MCVCVPVSEHRVLISISSLLYRCLRVRSADVSQVAKCCVLWQPALRQSVWTRSTSRISAVPSARVVSGDNLLQQHCGEHFIPVQPVYQETPLQQTGVKCNCSRAPQQKLWEQGSTTLISLMQSTNHAALQCSQPLVTSVSCIFEVMGSFSVDTRYVFNEFWVIACFCVKHWLMCHFQP